MLQKKAFWLQDVKITERDDLLSHLNHIMCIGHKH